MAAATQDSEKENVLSMINSCLVSTKDPLSLDHLQRDYKEIVGSPIPFRKFGFNNFEQFLTSNPKYAYVYSSGSFLYAQAPKTAGTNHIAALVQGQKRSKSKSFHSKPPPARRPYSSWAPPPRFQRQRFAPRREEYFHTSHNEVYMPPHKRNYDNPVRQANNWSNKKPLLKQPQHNWLQEPVAKPYWGHSVADSKPLPKMQQLANNRTSTLGFSASSTSEPRPKSSSTTLKPQGKANSAVKEKTYMERLQERFEMPITTSVITAGKNFSYYLASVYVDKKAYHSYPLELPSQTAALEEAAKKALAAITANSPSSFAETKNFILVYQRIKEMLDTNRNGYWWQSLSDDYTKKFQETISDDWLSKAPDHITDISFEKIADKKVILRPKELRPIIPVPVQREKRIEPPPFILPTTDEWCVHVSYIMDCSNISFRILGEQHSECLQALVTDMELYYMDCDKRRQPHTLHVGQYFVCDFDQSLLRAQVSSIENDEATVLFIDYGDQETLSISHIFEIEERFLMLPAQVITASLAGLECYLQESNTLSILNDMALGKMLIVQVHSREEDFISVVLYDTSTDEDININEKLLDAISDSFSEPELPMTEGICEVYVTHVSDSGDISVQIEYGTYKTLESLLALIKKQAYLLGNEDLSIDVTKLYLAKFSKDGEWHRSVPRNDGRNSQGQKILVRLVNVPPQPELMWTERTTERLESLLPKDKPLMLKVVSQGEYDELPLVKLFKRIEERNVLITINDNLSMDLSLFTTENNNTLTLPKSQLALENGISVNSISDQLLIPTEQLALMPLPSPPLPSVGSFFDVKVTYAASPSHFAVQPFADVQGLNLLMGEMYSFYSDESNKQSPGVLLVGGFYALLHSDNSWYRVRIDNVQNSSLVAGLFVDYGDCFCIENTPSIQPLWKNFRNFPAQALKAKLGGVSPKHGDWSPEDSLLFQKMVEDKEFVSKILKINLPMSKIGSTELELDLIDTHDEEVDLYIDDCLIKKDIAVRVPRPS